MAVTQGFTFLLNYVIPEMLPPLLMNSAFASRSVLEPAGIGSIGHRGSFQQLLTGATPIALPATKTLPCKPSTAGMRGYIIYLTPTDWEHIKLISYPLQIHKST